MITCPECDEKTLEGTLFCPNCGEPLQGEVDEGKTGTIPFAEHMVDGGEPPLVGKQSRPLEDVAAIRFIIPASGRRVSVPLGEQIRLGREDRQRAIRPELDLSEDGGAQSGVSRMHASIVRTPQGVAIMDLSSVNGTRVNGFLIPPTLPYALNSGDELKLGDLLIHVFFEG